MTVFERIKTTAKNRGWSLQEVAQRAGIGINTIYGWKKGTPAANKLQAVADKLDVSVDYLLGNTDNPSTDTQHDTKPNDLSEDVPFAFEGREIPAEQMELIRQMLANFKGDGDK
ncbi:helix-turn-helix transcriptional regulator [Lacticaseibacillus pabuli]|uniref:Helix-turn-helix transcriptional regulator n=1 Tax=Lacticaseibacillus pabuli TaxID=3025672 RepID=A0ABY7WTW1_9LACO|nr:helix-turn-helix transcriptional regulator [Lacticaseibacillus sp. KACC 23028]WDF83597.1 helix-turn-helix transcriptional regulator [Lacticaseibacillus sp. KACC 23028]